MRQPGNIKLAKNLPILQNTSFRWIIGRSIRRDTTPSTLCGLICAVFDNNKSLEQATEQLWKSDEIESDKKEMSPEEKPCESHFNQQVHTNADDLFMVSLPFRENLGRITLHSLQPIYKSTTMASKDWEGSCPVHTIYGRVRTIRTDEKDQP